MPRSGKSPSTSASNIFFFNDTATTDIYTLSLHDALPIFTGPIRCEVMIFNLRRGSNTLWRKGIGSVGVCWCPCWSAHIDTQLDTQAGLWPDECRSAAIIPDHVTSQEHRQDQLDARHPVCRR